MDSINNRPATRGFGLLAVLLCCACSGPSGEQQSANQQTAKQKPSAASSETGETVETGVTHETFLEIRSTSFPVDYLVRRLSPESWQVDLVMPVGEDPSQWQPTAEHVIGLASPEVHLIVAHGAGYEKWMGTVALPESRLLRAAADLDLLRLTGRTHSHGGGEEHSHVGDDPYTWLDPLLFQQEAQAIHGALVKLAGSASAVLDQRLEALSGELQALDRDLAATFAGLEGKVRWAQAHPSYNYLGRRYGFEVQTFDIDPATGPAKNHQFATWAARSDGLPVLLWPSAPTPGVLEMLENSAADLRHVVLDPLEQPLASGSYDYLAQARKNQRALADLASEFADDLAAPSAD